MAQNFNVNYTVTIDDSLAVGKLEALAASATAVNDALKGLAGIRLGANSTGTISAMGEMIKEMKGIGSLNGKQLENITRTAEAVGQIGNAFAKFPAIKKGTVEGISSVMSIFNTFKIPEHANITSGQLEGVSRYAQAISNIALNFSTGKPLSASKAKAMADASSHWSTILNNFSKLTFGPNALNANTANGIRGFLASINNFANEKMFTKGFNTLAKNTTNLARSLTVLSSTGLVNRLPNVQRLFSDLAKYAKGQEFKFKMFMDTTLASDALDALIAKVRFLRREMGTIGLMNTSSIGQKGVGGPGQKVAPNNGTTIRRRRIGFGADEYIDSQAGKIMGLPMAGGGGGSSSGNGGPAMMSKYAKGAGNTHPFIPGTAQFANVYLPQNGGVPRSWYDYLKKKPRNLMVPTAESQWKSWVAGASAYPEWQTYKASMNSIETRWYKEFLEAQRVAGIKARAKAAGPTTFPYYPQNMPFGPVTSNPLVSGFRRGANVFRPGANTPIQVPHTAFTPMPIMSLPSGISGSNMVGPVMISRGASPFKNNSWFTGSYAAPYTSGAAQSGAAMSWYNSTMAGFAGRAKSAKLPPVRTNALSRAKSNLSYKILGPSMLDSGGLGITSMLKGMGVMYGISGIGGMFSKALKDYVEYDNIMRTTRNILGSHDNRPGFMSRFSTMANVVRNIGVETKFTAPEVADAAKFLAMAGYNVETIKKTIKPIADIALVGDTELGTTADLMTNVMTAYNIGPDEMRRAADVMTNTFTMSNTTLTELAEAYKYSAGLMNAYGVSFQESAGALGILGNAGIKSSQAGTTMRTIIANLLNPTLKQAKAWQSLGLLNENGHRLVNVDEDGNITNTILKREDGTTRSLIEVFEMLKSVGNVNIYRLFHKTAAQGAIALMKGVDNWNNIVANNFLSDGMTEKLAEEKKKTISGLWAQLTSMFTEDSIRAFSGINNKITDFLQSGINILNPDNTEGAAGEIKNALTDIVGLLDNVKDVSKFIFSIWKDFGPLIMGYMKFQMWSMPFLLGARGLKAGANAINGMFAMTNAIGSFTSGIGSTGMSLLGKRGLFSGGRYGITGNKAFAAGNRRYGFMDLFGRSVYHSSNQRAWFKNGIVPGTARVDLLTSDPANVAIAAKTARRQSMYDSLVHQYRLSAFDSGYRKQRSNYVGDLRILSARKNAITPFMTGASAIAGGVGGGMFGSYLAKSMGAEEGGFGHMAGIMGGSLLGAGIAGGIGAKLSTFVAANLPYFGIAALVAGIGLVSYKLYQAKRANEEFVQSMQKEWVDSELALKGENNHYLAGFIDGNNRYNITLKETIELLKQQKEAQKAFERSAPLTEVDPWLAENIKNTPGILYTSSGDVFDDMTGWHGAVNGRARGTNGVFSMNFYDPNTGGYVSRNAARSMEDMYRIKTVISRGFEYNNPLFKHDNEGYFKKWLGTTNLTERKSAGEQILASIRDQYNTAIAYTQGLGLNPWGLSEKESNMLGGMNPMYILGNYMMWDKIISDPTSSINIQGQRWDQVLKLREKFGDSNNSAFAAALEYLGTLGSYRDNKGNQIAGEAAPYGYLFNSNGLPDNNWQLQYGIVNGLPTDNTKLSEMANAYNGIMNYIAQYVPKNYQSWLRGEVEALPFTKIARSGYVPSADMQTKTFELFDGTKVQYRYGLNSNGEPSYVYDPIFGPKPGWMKGSVKVNDMDQYMEESKQRTRAGYVGQRDEDTVIPYYQMDPSQEDIAPRYGVESIGSGVGTNSGSGNVINVDVDVSGGFGDIQALVNNVLDKVGTELTGALLAMNNNGQNVSSAV